MVRKLTRAKMRYFLKDEKLASREYRRYGLKRFSRDEYRHSLWFKRKLRRRNKRR